MAGTPSSPPPAPEGDAAGLEESAEDLYENAPCGYLSARPDGTIARVNATLLRWTGYARAELVGRRRIQDLLTPGGRIFHETHYAPLLRMQGAVREIAVEIVCRDGRRLPVLINSTVRHDAEGRPLVTRTTVFDATDRRRYERELVGARERERQARWHTERLQQLTATLAAGLDSTAIATAVVQQLSDGFGAGQAALAVFPHGGGERLEAIAARGWSATTLEDWAEHGLDASRPTARALAAGEATFLGPGEPDGAVPPALAPADRPDLLAVLPMSVGGRALGVLCLGFSGRELPAEERDVLVACAGQCAQALERARLHDATAELARRAAFIAEMSRTLEESHRLEQRARRLVGMAVPGLADRAAVTFPGPGELGPLAVGAGDEALTPARGSPPGPHVALPLRARGQPVGWLELGRSAGGPPFTASERAFLGELADRAGLALENARLYEQERDAARTLQQSLLAGSLPADPRFAVATRYRPAVATLEVGGDWYDAFTGAPGRLGVVVGDVVGRGIDAASAMGQLRSAIRALSGVMAGPAALITRLDTFVDRIEAAEMATLAFADIELDTGRTRLAVAGHPPPVVMPAGGSPRLVWSGRSPPIGWPGPEPRGETELVLHPGDRLLLYTDGLVERRRESLDRGLERLLAELVRHEEAEPDALVSGLTTALLDEDGGDDVCLLCLAYSGSAAGVGNRTAPGAGRGRA